MNGLIITLFLTSSWGRNVQPNCAPNDVAAAIERCPETLIPIPKTSQDSVLLRKAAEVFTQMKRAREEEARLDTEVRNLDSAIEALPLMDYFKKAALKKERDKKAAELNESRNQDPARRKAAIEATIAAFNLTPPIVSVPDDVRMLHNVRRWNPTYGCEQKHPSGQCRELNENEKKYSPDIRLGKTTLVGAQIWIYPEAFDSPEMLATVIFHEGIHWVHSIQRGGLQPTPEEFFKTEREAYARQASAALQLGLATKAGEWGTRATDAGAAEAEVKGKDWEWVRRNRPGLLRKFGAYSEISGAALSSRDGEADKVQAESDFFESVARQARELADARDRAADEERRRLADAEARRLAALPPAGAPKDPYWEGMRRWATTACGYLEKAERVPVENLSDPSAIGWAVQENDRRFAAKAAADAAARDYLLRHLVVMEKTAVRKRLEGETSLDSCERGMIELIVSADGPLSAEWLVQQLDYRKGGGAVGKALRAIGDGIRSGAAGLIQGIKAPFIAIDGAVTAIQEAKRLDPEKPEAAPTPRPTSPPEERATREREEREPRELRGVSGPPCMQGDNPRCVRW